MSGKISRYILYGVGEILLVVIGILLALQINGWQQYRQNRLIEKDLLERVVSDLEKDILELESLIDNNDDLKYDLLNIILGLGNNKIRLDDFVQWNSTFMGYETFQINNSTYSTAISTGEIGQILNKHLRDRILQYYALTQLPGDKLVDNLLLNQLIPIWNEKLAHTKEYNLAIGAYNNEYDPVKILDYYNDIEYRNIISQKFALLNYQIVEWQNKADEIDGLKNDIKEELDKRWEEN